MKDTVIFQGVTQFITEDGTAVRAINQGGGQLEIMIRHGEFFCTCRCRLHNRQSNPGQNPGRLPGSLRIRSQMVTPLASAPNDAFGALQRERARAALASLFAGDALAMPVHLY